MRNGMRIVDADAHVIEPHTLWHDYLDPSLRDRAPRAVGLTFGFEFETFSVNLPGQWLPGGSPEDVALMRTLARRQREVLACRYVLELSVAETAQLLEISKGSVKAHTHRGLQALQQRSEVTR